MNEKIDQLTDSLQWLKKVCAFRVQPEITLGEAAARLALLLPEQVREYDLSIVVGCTRGDAPGVQYRLNYFDSYNYETVGPVPSLGALIDLVSNKINPSGPLTVAEKALGTEDAAHNGADPDCVSCEANAAGF